MIDAHTHTHTLSEVMLICSKVLRHGANTTNGAHYYAIAVLS